MTHPVSSGRAPGSAEGGVGDFVSGAVGAGDARRAGRALAVTAAFGGFATGASRFGRTVGAGGPTNASKPATRARSASNAGEATGVSRVARALAEGTADPTGGCELR
jgi:hypothetical protein